METGSLVKKQCNINPNSEELTKVNEAKWKKKYNSAIQIQKHSLMNCSGIILQCREVTSPAHRLEIKNNLLIIFSLLFLYFLFTFTLLSCESFRF